LSVPRREEGEIVQLLFFIMEITFIDFIWIKFTIDTNWIKWIFIFITSINCYSIQCWNSLLIIFFILYITFIHFIWIQFTINANWIICIFIFITSINYYSIKCWNSLFILFFIL
jgi:hypothetical protein